MAVSAIDDPALLRRRGRRTMFAVFAVCAAPIVLGTLAYYAYRPEGTTNYGELLAPRPIDWRAIALDDGSPAEGRFAGRWVLVTIDAEGCDEACRGKLFVTRQVRVAQGRDQDRVERLWLSSGPTAAPDATLDALLAGAPAGRIAASSSAERIFGAAPGAHIHLVDPMGNHMMRFPAAPDPRRMIADLQKLLKVNARGR